MPGPSASHSMNPRVFSPEDCLLAEHHRTRCAWGTLGTVTHCLPSQEHRNQQRTWVQISASTGKVHNFI